MGKRFIVQVVMLALAGLPGCGGKLQQPAPEKPSKQSNAGANTDLLQQPSRDVPLWPGRLGGPGVGGNPDQAPLPKGGIFQWHYPKDQQGLTDEVFVLAPVAAMGDRLLASLAGEVGRRGVSCLPAETTQLDRPSPHWVYKTKNEVWRSSAVHEDSALLVDGKVGDEERFLHCVDMTTGKRRWRAAVTSKASGRMVVAPDRVFIQDDESQLTCLVNGKSELVLFKPDDGAEVARQQDALAVVAPVLDDEAVLFATADQICRLDLSVPDAEPSRWADLSWLGEPVTPMVYYRECLYLGIRGWGLVRFGDVGR